MAGINEATNLVTSYFDPGTKLIYAIGAVVGLIGGIKVYGKFSSGDPDTSKTAASLVRGVHLPDCERDDSPFVLPLINGHTYTYYNKVKGQWLNTLSTRA